jgi:hypothetical protein
MFMRSSVWFRLAILPVAGMAGLLAQEMPLDPQSSFNINLPSDAPVALRSANLGESRAMARGSAMVIDLHMGLTLRNASNRRISGVTFLVSAQEVTVGGKGSVATPCLHVGPGEAFPVRIDLRLLRPTQAAAGPLVQVSLDGGCPEDHDAYRGAGTWAKTVAGIELLQANGFRVRLGTTETPVNSARLNLVCEFHRRLGIPDEDHFVRPLAKRGFSREGLELGRHNLVPELTANLDGLFWHPLSTDADMQVSRQLFPLAESVAKVQAQLDAIASTGQVPLMTFT